MSPTIVARVGNAAENAARHPRRLPNCGEASPAPWTGEQPALRLPTLRGGTPQAGAGQKSIRDAEGSGGRGLDGQLGLLPGGDAADQVADGCEAQALEKTRGDHRAIAAGAVH